MTGYVTLEGDVLDRICLDQLGAEHHVAAVLAVNPGLAALGVVLPAGVAIVLPDLPEPAAPPQIRLWGAS